MTPTEWNMKVVVSDPPMFEQIKSVFPDAIKPGVIFAWGDTIYTRSPLVIPPALIAHEMVHGERQRRVQGVNGSNIERWWLDYLKDPEFRYREELAAHIAEYQALMPKDRNQRAKVLMATAQRLTAPLYAYGSKQPSLSQALCDLRYGLDHGLRS